ncbi:MAG: YihY/virulence factor BrkB family protein [Pirellulaceae bacterium]|nr:YihY/virulence factor BrkB family protein [Pirellulaceae bacterium]
MHKFPGKTFWLRLSKAAKNWHNDNCSTLAAAVSYYGVFALLPLLLLLISALGFALRFSSGAQNAREQLLDLVARNSSEAMAGHVGDVLGQISARAAVGGPVALAFLLLAAIGVFTQIEYAFDRIWRRPDSGSPGVIAAILGALYYRLRAFLILLGSGSLVLTAFAAGMAIPAIRAGMPWLPGGDLAWSLSETGLSISLYCLFFSVIYKALPKAKIRWAHAACGGLLAALLWETARRMLAFVVVGKTYTAYGVVGSMIAVMLWIYIACNILFIGAEYVRALGESDSPAA